MLIKHGVKTLRDGPKGGVVRPTRKSGSKTGDWKVHFYNVMSG